MSGEDKSSIYKALNECTAVLTQEVQLGVTAVYPTIDRYRYNELLKALAEAKRLLVRANTNFGDS